jgi:hypothetical protein
LLGLLADAGFDPEDHSGSPAAAGRHPGRPSWKQAGIFPVIPKGALRATLGILARTVARGYPGSPT